MLYFTKLKKADADNVSVSQIHLRFTARLILPTLKLFLK